MKPVTTKSRAFTLIELLAVIVAISLLMGLLLPVLASSKNNVKFTGCLSNLRLWAAAEQFYAVDNSDQIPRDGFPAGNSWPPLNGLADSNAWFNALPPYIGEQTMSNYSVGVGSNWRLKYPFPGNGIGKYWMCPAATMNTAGYTSVVSAGGGAYGFFSYAFNLDLKTGFTYPTMPKLGSLAKPASTVLMFDSAFDPLTEVVNTSPQYNSINPANRYKAAALRHELGALLSFCDGHVQYFRNYYLTNGSSAGSEPLHPDVIWNPVYRTTNP